MDCKIGFQHGREARSEIARGLRFYEQLFLKTNKLQWPQACNVAEKFLPTLETEWSDYATEMIGQSYLISRLHTCQISADSIWQTLLRVTALPEICN